MTAAKWPFLLSIGSWVPGDQRKKGSPLDDDEFLRNHWIVYFEYSRDQADQFSHALLNEVFTAARATSRQVTAAYIQEYVESIQEAVRQWHCLHFPERHPSLSDEVILGLDRLCRLGHGAFKPIILAALMTKASAGSVRGLVAAAERFVFLVSRVSKRRADAGDNNFSRKAHQCYLRNAPVEDATASINEWTDKHFDTKRFKLAVDELFKEGDGYYKWNGLRYFLFEYEHALQTKAKSSTTKISWAEFTRSKKDHVTVEHIYPRVGSKSCWSDRFGQFSDTEQGRLCHSLGNLVALAHQKNVSLSNNCFDEKKKSADGATGYFTGSYSEIEVAQEVGWNAQTILDRGLRMLDFLEQRWRVTLGDEEFKRALLGLDWLKT